MHSGLRKLFYNLSTASERIEQRKIEREKLHGYLRKIKIISSRTPKKSVIAGEITKLEKHLSTLLDKKLHIKYAQSKREREELKNLHKKEELLNRKISKMNEYLSLLGKKVNESRFKKELEQDKEEPSMLEKLENKLYSLESKYHQLEDDPKYPRDIMYKLKDKISELKEKIRELKK